MNKEHFQISAQEATAIASKHESEARFHRLQESLSGFTAVVSALLVGSIATESLIENSDDINSVPAFALTIIGSLALVISRNQSSKANVHEQTAANLHSHAEINQL